MRRIGFSLVLLGLLCGGCLQQARTPYNEVGRFSFLHKLFRLEKLPDGTLDWTLFWL